MPTNLSTDRGANGAANGAANEASALAASAAANAYSQAQKGAIIVALLGAQYAKPIVDNIDDRHLHSFVTAMKSISLVPRAVLLTTIADFITEMKTHADALQGGEAQAKELAAQLLSTERAERLFGGEKPARPDDEIDIWARLKSLNPVRLAAYLDGQRPELSSTVLTQLGAVKAGEVLAELSDKTAGVVARTMSQGALDDPEILTAIAELVKIELLDKAEDNGENQAASFLTDVMGVLPKTRREALMDILVKESPKTAEKIRRGLLTFEDLPARLPKSAIPLIFRDMDPKDLLAALKAGVEAAPDTTDFLYANISQRMAEQFKEQVDDRSELSEKDAETAIITMMSFISRQEKSGAIAYIDVIEEM